MTKSERWILSEWRVACDRARHFHEELVAHRAKTPYAEIDLLFRTSTESFNSVFTLVEVKTWSRSLFGDLNGEQVISRKQLLRLSRARWFVETRVRRPTRLLIAVASEGLGEIQYFEPPPIDGH